MLKRIFQLIIIIIVAINLGLMFPTVTLAQTGTCQNSVQHNGATPTNTEHRMVVCGDGNIATSYGLFLKTITLDEGKDDGLGDLTTMGIHFDQHGSNVDIGWQGDFQPTDVIRLNRPAYFGPYSEEAYSRYKSRNLPYEIEQRTLTIDSPWADNRTLGDTNNWVVMELLIRNTGSINLTGGRLLYMADFDPGTFSPAHKGFYDYDTATGRGVAYHTQQPNPGQPYSDRGFGIGISLLNGTLLGHGLSNSSSYPNNDATFLTQINSPMYPPTQPVANTTKADYISWLVIQIPPLAPGAETKIAVGWCASVNTNANTVATLIKSCLTTKPYLPALKVEKTTAMTGYVGIPTTFTYTISSRYAVSNLAVTSLSDSLVGNISVGGLGTYITTYTITPGMTTPVVSTITIQGNYNGVTVISQTINHALPIDFRPLLTLTVSSVPTTKANVTKEITYTIRVSHATTSDFSSVSSLSIGLDKKDRISYISGDTNGNGRLDGSEMWVYEAKYIPTISDPNPLVNTITVNGKDANNEPISATTTNHTLILAYNPKLQIVKSGPGIANANTIGTFSFRISHADDSDNSSVTVQTIVDNIAGQAVPVLTNGNNIGDTNRNTLLDKDEEWYYLIGYLFTISPPNPLVNQATVTWKDLEGDLGTAKSNFHATTIVPGGSATTLEIRQDGSTTIRVGETMTYDIIIGHASNSGGAAVTIAAITDSLAFLNPINFTPSFITGDEDQDGKLDANETFHFQVSFVVTNSTTNSFSHTMTVEGRDPENKAIFATTVPPIFTKIEYESRLMMTKTGPDTATVGQQVTYDFTIQHDPNSDGVAVFFGDIDDNVVGSKRSCSGKGNGDFYVDENETWQCVSNPYEILSTDPAQLTNIATVNGLGKGERIITATAQHTTRIEFAPQLVASVSSLASQVQIGNKFSYVVTLRHQAITDQSPITISEATDNLGNPGSCQAGSGGNGDGKLDEGETWYCEITATIPITNLDPLTLTITAKGMDGNNDEISTTTQYSVDILFKPIVQFTLAGPTVATRGDTIQYQITVNHAPNSDNSEVCGLQLYSNLWSLPRSIVNAGDDCLGQGEVWQSSIPYTISQNAPFDLENIAFVSYTMGDNIQNATNKSQVITRLQGPQLEIIIQPNPMTLTVGQKVSVTYQVTRLDANLDIIDSSLVLSSSLFGQAIRTVGSSPLLQGQTWTYTVAYTPLTDTPHKQTAEVVAISQGSIIGRSEVNITVIHTPVLMLKVISKEGGFYTFLVDHANTSDKSPVTFFKVNGKDTSCTVLTPSTCTFTDTVAINAKFHEALIEYTTLDSPLVVSQTFRFDLIPQTYLPLIRKSPNDNPAMTLEKAGPTTAKAGDTIKYTFTLKHDLVQGQSTAVCNITLSDPLIPNLSQTHTGDSNGNACLNSDETWVYEANYTIPADKTGSVDNTATITGKSAESGKTVSASDSWSTPIVVVNDCVAQTETFADSSSGWLVSSGPKAKWEYLNGQYVATSIDPNALHFATSPKKSASADYLVSVEANWNSPIGDEYGLIFNVIGSGDTASMYLFNINAQTASYKLRRLLNGVSYTTLSSGTSSQIKSGTTINKLQLQRTGNTFNLYVNDQLLGSASDSSLSASTTVGVNMLPSLSQKGQAAYDNFTICSDGGVQTAEVDTPTPNAILGDIKRP